VNFPRAHYEVKIVLSIANRILRNGRKSKQTAGEETGFYDHVKS
jgi:hypothetical protein